MLPQYTDKHSGVSKCELSDSDKLGFNRHYIVQSGRFTQLALSQTSNLNNKRSIKHNNNYNRVLQWKVEWQHDIGKMHVQKQRDIRRTFKT